jgi:hypothetical protein
VIARVTLELPSLLRNLLATESLSLEGSTLNEALQDAYAQLPGCVCTFATSPAGSASTCLLPQRRQHALAGR